MDENHGPHPDKPPEGQIKAEDIASQIMVVRTKDNKIALQFPTNLNGTPDIPQAMNLLAQGLNVLAQILQGQTQALPEKPRIVLAPAIPKEFLTKGLKAE